MKKKERMSQQDSFVSRCMEKGLRVTPQRSVIYGEIIKAEDHPSTDLVYRRVRRVLPNISFDTVYRTLLLFSETGLINIVEGTGENARFEPNLHNHHHCRCLKCREIIDFTSEECSRVEIPAKISERFNVKNKRVIVEGFCEKCGGRE